LDELETCQQATGGYLLGTRHGRSIFARVEKEGKFEGFAPWGDGGAEPYYALEKIFSALRDAYRAGGRPKALQIETRLGDWLDGHMSHLSDRQMADLMTVEFGGMNWVLSDLYADTGDARYLALSRRWQDKRVFAGPAAGKDDLAGRHANTQFPKFSGLAARYPFSGDPADLKTAAFFWESVARHHSYVTGGNSLQEHFGLPDKLNDCLSQFTEELESGKFMQPSRVQRFDD
ncbi:MAG: beta-L-arabinofuranosidase domain-containing protein, partial [Terracidiphilus sp.]